MKQQQWLTLEKFVEIKSPWLTLIGEKLQDERGKIIDYWRVEKADSVVILTIQNNYFILPLPIYRPGLAQATLDFPGGRVASGQTPLDAVPVIINRELGIETTAITKITALNSQGWAINSSFSNQKLYGFVAELSEQICLNQERIGAIYPTNQEGVNSLLRDLSCLQCRALLLEWQNCQSAKKDSNSSRKGK